MGEQGGPSLAPLSGWQPFAVPASSHASFQNCNLRHTKKHFEGAQHLNLIYAQHVFSNAVCEGILPSSLRSNTDALASTALRTADDAPLSIVVHNAVWRAM